MSAATTETIRVFASYKIGNAVSRLASLRGTFWSSPRSMAALASRSELTNRVL